MLAVGDQTPESREPAREPEQVTTSETVTWQSPDRDRGYSGDTSQKLYLCEIGKVKLLTRAEETELAARVQKGDKKAREEMIKANLRLVVKIARDYEGLGVPLLDLISEGNIGLMKAVERFDPSKGAKLSTYGSWWIKQAIKAALANQSKTIRLPVHMVDKISKMKRAAGRLQEAFGREAMVEGLNTREASVVRARFGLDGRAQKTLEEIGMDLGVTRERVRQIESSALKKLRAKVEKVERIRI